MITIKTFLNIHRYMHINKYKGMEEVKINIARNLQMSLLHLDETD